MTKRFAACLISLFAVLAQSNYAKGDSGSAGNLGVFGGVASLNNGGGSPGTFGVSFDYGVMDNFTAGLRVGVMNPSQSVNNVSYSQSLTNFDLAFKYQMGEWNAGVLLGVGLTTTSVPNASNSTDFNYGVTGGYDWKFMSDFSVGPELSWIGTSLSGGYSQTYILAKLKYWF